MNKSAMAPPLTPPASGADEGASAVVRMPSAGTGNARTSSAAVDKPAKQDADAAPPAPTTDSPQTSVVVVHDAESLKIYVKEWEDLAANAVEPNVFYEPWMLLPAMELLHEGAHFVLALVFVGRGPTTPGTLIGFFPFELTKSLGRFPPKTLRLWRHNYLYSCTPLVRVRHGELCLDALFDWLATTREGAGLVRFDYITGDGQFFPLLDDAIRKHRSMSSVGTVFSRAAFRRAADAETYLKHALSGDYRRQMKRKERRLADSGQLDYVTLEPDGDLENWLENFLRLESSGWKGKEGTALASTPSDREFFLRFARDAFRQNRLIMQGLNLDGRPIAQYCALTAGHGSFDFKPAYDEDYGRYSPGILLELERFRYLHTRPELDWMDSCSKRDSFRNALWGQRRVIVFIAVSAGKISGDLRVATWPILRWMASLVRRVKGSTTESLG